jgi:hypothetical protein
MQATDWIIYEFSLKGQFYTNYSFNLHGIMNNQYNKPRQQWRQQEKGNNNMAKAFL